MRYLLGLLIVAAACGGAKAPETTASPAAAPAAPVLMKGTEPEAAPVAVAAARTLEPQAKFAGVFLNGREVKALTFAVVQETKLEHTPGGDGKTPFVICKLSGSGPPSSSPCPMSLSRNGPVIYTFTAIKSAADGAMYVSVNAMPPGSAPEARCIEVRLSAGEWKATKTTVADPRRCPAP